VKLYITLCQNLAIVMQMIGLRRSLENFSVGGHSGRQYCTVARCLEGADRLRPTAPRSCTTDCWRGVRRTQKATLSGRDYCERTHKCINQPYRIKKSRLYGDV